MTRHFSLTLDYFKHGERRERIQDKDSEFEFLTEKMILKENSLNTSKIIHYL